VGSLPIPARKSNRSATGKPSVLPAIWRHLLETPQPSTSQPSTALGFLLEIAAEEHAAAWLDVAPVLLDLTDNQRLPRPHPLNANHLTEASLGLAEQRLAACILGLPHVARKGRRYARLKGYLGDALLTEMLDVSPCLLGGVAGLCLTRGRPHPLVWEWHIETDGQQRLYPRLEAGQHLLRIGGLWCLDIEHATLAPFEGQADEAALLDFPPLAASVSTSFAAALPQSPLAKRIPPPTQFDRINRADLVPQPVLTLHALTRHTRLATGTIPLAYARLCFDYGGERLPGRGGEVKVQRVHAGNLVEIIRRRAEELAHMEQLEVAGLTPAVDTEGLPWDLADTLPEDAWLFPGTGHSGALEVNTPARWLGLREKLEPDGFQFDYAPSFPFEVLEEPLQWYVKAGTQTGENTFRLDLGLVLDEQRLPLLKAVSQALADHQFSLQRSPNEPDDAVWYAPIDERRRIPIRLSILRALLAPLAEYLDKPCRDGNLHLPRVQTGRLEELRDALPEVHSFEVPDELSGFASHLTEVAKNASDQPPAGLQTTLRSYQRDGLRWMNALAKAELGGILADDMGLGKTVQLIAHLLALRESGALEHPVLIVAPTSLLPNWESELDRFAPDLRRHTLHGPQRAASFTSLHQYAVVLTSYALLPRDVEALQTQRFALVVLDEAQQVKNPRALARRALLRLDAPRRLALTGTPLENHLGELWSQMDLCVPGLLGDEHGFRRHYRQPIEKQDDNETQLRLNRRIAPFILRRSKAEVATELPPKTEIIRNVRLYGPQRELYESLRLSLGEELRQIIVERGVEHSGIVVLDALLKLRQVCCDPRLLKLQAAHGIQQSAKLEMLMEMLPALVDEGRNILLFSQFTSMLALIAQELDQQRIPYELLTGNSRDRTTPVKRFQAGKVPLFLLSLKAGGVGLNLTAADTVIHYDPWWNPAAEAQASDRAHRIGQEKPVFIYRLVTVNSVEERIEAMKARKAALANALFNGGSSKRLHFDAQDIETLLAPL